MNKKKSLKEEIKEEQKKTKIFSNFKIPIKPEYIKNRIKSGSLTINDNNTILKTVEIGNDPNYRKYLRYLNNLRKKEKEEYLEYLRQQNKKDPLLSKLDVNKKISFPDFCDKYKINSYIMDYLDYYEIQKINKKQTAELIKILKERIRKEKNKSNSPDERKKSIETLEKNYKNFRRRISSINLQNWRRSEKRISMENLYNKHGLYIEGIDFNLIKNLYTEIEENDKKYMDLCLNNEIKKRRKNYNKKMNQNNNKYSITDNNFDSDEYTIYHSLDNKTQKKLNKLKLIINKKLESLDKYRPKTSKPMKTLPNKDPTILSYLTYIPDSSKYKHINYQKNLIFNNEYTNNSNIKNKFRNKYNNIKTESNIYNNNNLLATSNKVINNLNKIKTILKKDKNYTSKTINRANTAFKRTEKTTAEKRLMENLMKDNKKTIRKFLELKAKMEKRRKHHVFKELKGMMKTSEKKGIECTDIFSKTLNALYKEEKKENKQYNNYINHNYFIKLDKLKQNTFDNENAKQHLERIQHSYERLKLNIKKRYKEINNIIKTSKKKSKNF